MAIKLEKDVHAYLIGSIKQFFLKELDEEIGDLKAERVLDFFVKEMGPSVYNRAIADARTYFQEKASELGDVRYEAEFDFWRKR